MKKLKDHANKMAPYESCSILLGGKIKNQFHIKKILHIENRAKSEINFQMDPFDLIRAYNESIREKMDVIGIFHSHTHEAQPSDTDLRYMEINPVLWLIYSISQAQFHAYVLENKLISLSIEIKD